ncbi:MAG: hypothetical protein MUF87_08885 [Anaerolineae bacterium]|jgi:hypothetical protein|nr:hypothetical protein [Anaerolineae bacterium]
MKLNRLRSLLQPRYIPLLLVVILIIGGMILQRPANQLQPAPPLSFEGTFFTERDWYRAGRDIARFSGLVGTPTEERGALMTFGSYVTLNPDYQSDNQFEGDHPIFVYQAFGDIQGSSSRDDIEVIEVLFDATDALPFSTAAIPRDHATDLSFIPIDAGIRRPIEIPPTMIP